MDKTKKEIKWYNTIGDLFVLDDYTLAFEVNIYNLHKVVGVITAGARKNFVSKLTNNKEYHFDDLFREQIKVFY